MTPRLLKILNACGDYYTLTRAMIQNVCGEMNDRVMRKHLQQLCDDSFLAKTRYPPEGRRAVSLAVSHDRYRARPPYYHLQSAMTLF